MGMLNIKNYTTVAVLCISSLAKKCSVWPLCSPC